MYNEFDDSVGPEPGRSCFRRVIFVVLAVVIVLSLLGSSIAGLFWLLSWQRTENVIPTLAPTAAVVVDVPTAAARGAPETTVEPAPSTPGINRIVFINQERQVETVAPDGSTPRVLTAARQAFQFPAWSPDSQYVAAIGAGGAGSGIYILRDLVGGETQAEPGSIYFSRNQTPIYLYWSPNSRQVSFIAAHPSDGIGLHLASVEDNEADNRLLATGSPFYWNWSADGQQMLIHTGTTGEGSRLALIDVAGQDESDNIATPGFFQAPGISANGRYLAYAEITAFGVSSLVVADRERGEQYREPHAGLVAMGWSPTTDQLAFISGSQESSNFFGPLRLLDAQTGEVRLLSREVVLAFFWSPDGRYIAYINPPNSGDGSIQASLPAMREVLRNRLVKSSLQRIPSFKLVVMDVMTGQGHQLATFEPTLTFLTQFLPFFDQYALSHRLWSPDSTAIVLPMREEGRSHVFVISMDDGTMRKVGEGDMAFWSQR